MATRTKGKAAPKPDTRPFFTVTVTNPTEVHRAIAAGNLPLSAAPINIIMLHAWAHDNCKTAVDAYGLEVRPKA